MVTMMNSVREGGSRMREGGQYTVLRGPYLGDVSALCFVPSSPVSYLLAGALDDCVFRFHGC